jgi:cobalt-zinc-cadmium efflux system membrane fusion protein
MSYIFFFKDVNKLYVGQIVTAFTNNDPTTKHRCEIILIGKDVNSDRTVNVHCHFDAYDKLLIPGTYMNAEITLKENAANVLPEEAIVRFENGTYIFAATGERTYKMIAVKTGLTENGFTEILPDGNRMPEKVVVKGSYNLLMSLKNTGE